MAGNVAVVNDDGNATVDGGFSIPVPETGDTGKFVKATGEGTYGVATIEQSDVNGLSTALGGKVDKVTSATTGNLVEFGASGAVADSGVVADNVLQTTDYILLQCVIE